MTAQLVSEFYSDLSDSQKIAADWNDGAFLLLAGPGSGKTRVLTARIARIITESEEKKFRVLALTFTNQAAIEMRDRLEGVISQGIERVFVGTFHSFCAELLRQHGSHVNVRPDFQIVSEDIDRKRILKRAFAGNPNFQTQAVALSDRNIEILPLIDRIKAKLVEPEMSADRFRDQELGSIVKSVYQLYDNELEARNSLDFNSILLKTYKLVTEFPNIARNIRITYRYWAIDEFQDINESIYRVLKAIGGPKFRNIFVVADEDQIIYQWNGASYKRIQDLIKDYDAKVYQLPTNYRCSASIVEIANKLISYNKQRQEGKKPTKAVKPKSPKGKTSGIELLSFVDAEKETIGVAEKIKDLRGANKSIALLARNRYLLEPVQVKLHEQGVPSRIVQRRTDFVSAPYSLGYKLLKFCVRNQDEDLLSACTDVLAGVTEIVVSADDIRARAKSSNADLYSTLILELERVRDIEGVGDPHWEELLIGLRERDIGPKEFIDDFVDIATEAGDSESAESADLSEDGAAWSSLSRDIRRSIGSKSTLDRFVQEMDMRSKEPPLNDDEIPLMTIHGSKGREFDVVLLIGVAEEVLPSWHSLRKGSDSPELEEERRNCFVAITRARHKLIISYASRYKGYRKEPSRFLFEMGLLE